MKINNPIDSTHNNSPDDALRVMMETNIKDARRIYRLCQKQKCLDSQEFLNWQDELNDISVKYEPYE